MNKLTPFSLRSFKQKARYQKRRMRLFLTRFAKKRHTGLDKKINQIEKEVWAETDCLSCANCCKTMTPTFSQSDMKRIAAHFNQTVEEFQQKWLRKERGGERDWLNKTEPCQFLNLKDNKCNIYSVRPDDCAGFPHLSKKFKEYVHIHHQNVEYCPATYKLVEKMMERSKA